MSELKSIKEITIILLITIRTYLPIFTDSCYSADCHCFSASITIQCWAILTRTRQSPWRQHYYYNNINISDNNYNNDNNNQNNNNNDNNNNNNNNNYYYYNDNNYKNINNNNDHNDNLVDNDTYCRDDYIDISKEWQGCNI